MVELLIVVVVLLVIVLILMGIDSDSSKEDTLRAWKRLARIYHPDTSKDDGDEEK
jgi:curved DNA-binding protein CbpA